VYVGSGGYNVVCRSGGKALDDGGSSANGTELTQYSVMSGNANQQWLITAASGR